MVEVLALDPSIASAGVALSRYGVLVAAGRIDGPHGSDSVASKALDMACEVSNWWRDHACSADVILVSEWPQVYRAGKSKGDPNDLLGMGAVVGAVAALLQPEKIVTYTPAEWIGNLPKSTRHSEAFTSARGRRIMGRLSEAERAVVPRYHDAVDAVGLGLFYLGRLSRTRVFSR